MQTDKQTLAAGQTRLHGLDAVRAFALLLGVVLHATMSFFPGPQVWLVKDSDSSVVLSVTFFVIHMLRMLTFFLIAGFVARMSLGRLGPGPFFKDRLRRIGVPLILGWPVLFVALMAAAGMLGRGGGGGLSLDRFPLIHLWFLYLLGLFYLALALLHPLLTRTGRWGERVAGILLRPWAIAVLAAPLCLALYLQPYWVMWFGIPMPDTSFVPNLPALVAYGCAFAFGWLVQQRADVLAMWERRWTFNLALAVACTVFCLAQAGLTPLLMPVPQGQLKLMYAASYSLGAWAWALGLVGMAQRFLNRHSASRRYLADASYWIYLVHLPLVVALQTMLAPLAWPWALKFLLMLAAAFAAMLATYALLVRRTIVGVVLNGRTKS
jgi:glucans biosynthesis protein C